jgi:DNA-binding MarR family transcriptional regulator
MFTLLESRLARDLFQDSGLSMADCTVLSNLAEAEGRRWRLTALADHMRWSQSRLSHQVSRMEDHGLVTREAVADDGRGATIVLTRDGPMTVAAAAPARFDSVRRHMIDRRPTINCVSSVTLPRSSSRISPSSTGTTTPVEVTRTSTPGREDPAIGHRRTTFRRSPCRMHAPPDGPSVTATFERHQRLALGLHETGAPVSHRV